MIQSGVKRFKDVGDSLNVVYFTTPLSFVLFFSESWRSFGKAAGLIISSDASGGAEHIREQSEPSYGLSLSFEETNCIQKYREMQIKEIILERGNSLGAYLNPGNQNYQMAVNSEIFVDKTELIGYLNSVINTHQRFVSVTRPRRFGKTMAADMICAYYDREADSRELFENLKIAGQGETQEKAWDCFLGRFDVIRIVMTDFMDDCDTVEEMLQALTDEVTEELTEAYPDVRFGSRIRVRNVMNKIYGKTKRQFVVVIDEWDIISRVWKDDDEGQKKYLDFLRDWMKDKPYIALAYMTGILPIKKYGKHSALNMFDEYSMMSPKTLARYTGFTAEEVHDICNEKNLDFEAMKVWYDGYRISNVPSSEIARGSSLDHEQRVFEIYSPLSVVNAALYKRLENYWNKTETYEALAEYIRKDYDGLKDAVALLMDGGRIMIDTSTYQNDMTTFTGRDDVLSLLVHLGYLGYDGETSAVFIPNREILDEFKTSTKSPEWVSTFEAFEISQELLKATWECRDEKVAELLEKAHNKAANKTYHDEAALSYAIQYAYYAAQKYYTILPEVDTGKGFADVVFIPTPQYFDKPALLVELRHDKTAAGAIAQIKRQDYPGRLEHYKGNILMVGINYDKDVPNNKPEFKHHTCRIEKA